jgi:hypothetical protein
LLRQSGSTEFLLFSHWHPDKELLRDVHLPRDIACAEVQQGVGAVRTVEISRQKKLAGTPPGPTFCREGLLGADRMVSIPLGEPG